MSPWSQLTQEGFAQRLPSSMSWGIPEFTSFQGSHVGVWACMVHPCCGQRQLFSTCARIQDSGQSECNSEVGGLSSTGKSFRVVRACVRAVCMSSEFGAKKCGRPLSLFLLAVGGFPFSLSPPPISYPTSAGFISNECLA